MGLIIGIIALVILIAYLITKSNMNEEEKLGREQLQNFDNLDQFSQEIVMSWAHEMMRQVGTTNIEDKRVLRYIGIKVKQSRQIKGL